jgi:hypothetical protein
MKPVKTESSLADWWLPCFAFIAVFGFVAAAEILFHLALIRHPSGWWWSVYTHADSKNRREIFRFLIDQGLPCMVTGYLAGILTGSRVSFARWLVASLLTAAGIIALLPAYATWLPSHPLWWWPKTPSAVVGMLAGAFAQDFLIAFGSVVGGWMMRDYLGSAPYAGIPDSAYQKRKLI